MINKIKTKVMIIGIMLTKTKQPKKKTPKKRPKKKPKPLNLNYPKKYLKDCKKPKISKQPPSKNKKNSPWIN